MKKSIIIFVLLTSTFWLYSQKWAELSAKAREFYAAGKVDSMNYYKELTCSTCISEYGILNDSCMYFYLQIGIDKYFERNYTAADSIFRNAWNLQQPIEGTHNEILTIKGLAMANKHQHKNEEVTYFYHYADSLANVNPNIDKAIYIETCTDACLFFREIGEYGKVENYLQKAEEMIAADSRLKPILFSVVKAKLSFLLETGDIGNIERYFYSIEKQLTPLDTNNYPISIQYAELYSILGEYFMNIGQIEKSLYFLNTSVHLCEKYPQELQIVYLQATNSLGYLYTSLEKWDKALAIQQNCLATAKKELSPTSIWYGTILIDLAFIHFRQQQYEKAEPLILEAVKIAESHESKNVMMRAYRMLAMLYGLKGDMKNANMYFDKSMNEVQKMKNKTHPGYVSLLLNRGIISHANGYTDEAQRYLFEAINYATTDYQQASYYLSEEEMINYANSHYDIMGYLNYFMLHVGKKNTVYLDKYYHFLLANKGFELSSILHYKQQIEQLQDTSTQNLFALWKKKKKEYANYGILAPEQQAKYQENINTLYNEIQECEKKLKQNCQTFEALVQNTENDWKKIAKTLKKEELALDFVRIVIYEKNKKIDSIAYAALLITPDCALPKYIPLPNGKALESTFFANYQQAIENNTSTNEAYKAFWQPIEKEIGQAKTIYFAADGVYHNLNLALLQDEKGNFLLEKYELHQVFSTREVAEKRENIANQSIVLLGNPAFDLDKAKWQQQTQNIPVMAYTLRGGNGEKPASRQGFEPLLYAEKEVREIADLCRKQKWKTAIYTQNTATEDVLYQLQSPHILHIATHGYVEKAPSGENPMLHAGLYFAGAKTFVEDTTNEAYTHEDGILSAYESATLPLENTDLVVLSACETALGTVRNGEGVYGLQRGFKIAGAKSILMTLWQVPDAPTEAFIKDFYQALLSGKKAQNALKLAQIHAIKEKVPIKYWGAFVLVGQ